MPRARIGADHFAEAVITGTAVTRFAGRRNATRPLSLPVLPLDTGDVRQVLPNRSATIRVPEAEKQDSSRPVRPASPTLES